jgi:lipid A 3-O-deacylase
MIPPALRGYGVTELLHWRRVLGPSAAAFAVLSMLALAPGPAYSADLEPAPPAAPPYVAPLAPPPAFNFYDPYRIEVRFGGFAHGVGGNEKGTYDLNPELVLPRLPFAQGQWWSVFVPRPHVGALANLEGRTSAFYAGALWSFPLPYRTFFELFVDGAIHDGYQFNAPPGRSGLGCPALFHVGGSLGYAISEHWTAMITFDHLSDGHYIFGINCAGNVGPTANPGLNNWGGKIGYAF